MEDRDSRGRFIKGHPGGGRKKKDPTTQDLLRALSPQAVTRLGDLIHSDDEAVALQASFDILELVLKYDVSISEDEKERYEREIEISNLRLARARKINEMLIKFIKEQNGKGFFTNIKDVLKNAIGLEDSTEEK